MAEATDSADGRSHPRASGPGLATRQRRRHRPIPGTKRAARVEENVAADTAVLTAGQIARLDNLPVAAGDHHNETKCACSNASPSGAGEARARALVLNV